MIKREEIPNTDFVFRRVPHWCWDFEDHCAVATAFDDFKLSVDWDKYSNIEKTVVRDGQPKDNSLFGAVTLPVVF
jgi:hypothetical protein